MPRNNTVRGYPVQHGRCAHCGQKKPAWTPAQIIRAAREWAAVHGTPPKADQWRNGTPTHPSNTTVLLIFGTWNTMMETAGFTPREAHTETHWTQERIVTAMLDWVAAHHRWPTARDWIEAETGRPCTQTVLLRYGSWNNARRAAGYTGTPRKQHRAKAT